jgi:hypothetical protein
MSILSRVLGGSVDEMSEKVAKAPPVSEDVPVPCAAVTRSTFRDRLRKRRSATARVMGEAQAPEDSLIPDDAEEIESAGQPFQKQQKPVRDVVMEPNDPYADKEKLMTPAAALVAPDVTPQANQPLDPSLVPGAGQGSSFRTADVESEPQATGSSGPLPKRAMDVLLGRPLGPSQQAEPDAVVTAESAYRMLGVQSPAQLAALEASGGAPTGKAVLKEGEQMPDHKYSDGTQVLSAFRRFVG